MNVQDCLNRLALAELNNSVYSIDGVITETQKKTVIAFMNEALYRLYARFLLSEQNVFIECRENITKYYLTKEHLMSPTDFIDCSLEEINDKYLYDSPEDPFSGNVLKILDVIGSDGYRYPLNNPTATFSLFTPAYNVLQVPQPSCGEVLSVSFQARHEELSADRLDQEVKLPEALLGAFYAYVAYIAYTALQTEISMASAQKYYAQYKALVDEVYATDAVNDSISCSNVRFYKNGWC